MYHSPIRRYNPLSDKVRANGKIVLPLNIGQPDILTPGEFFDAIKDASTDRRTIAYTVSEGLPELRQAFSNFYKKVGLAYEVPDILVTTGGSEALLFTILTLADHGDNIIVFEPFYPNYGSLAKMAGVDLNPVMTKREDNFRMPGAEQIAKAINSKTKAILVTNPNNPTGVVLTKDEMDAVVEVAKQYNLYIIADEVYREFVYGDVEFISFASYTEFSDNVILCDSVSKRFSGCGVRIGCVASTNKEFMSQCLKMCQSRLSSPYIEQVGATALFNVDDSFIQEALVEYKSRRDVCAEVISTIPGLDFRTPDGAFYFIVKLPGINADDFTVWLLEEFDVDGKTIMLCPVGESYVNPQDGASEVRISYCGLSCDDLRTAMNILKEGIARYLEVVK